VKMTRRPSVGSLLLGGAVALSFACADGSLVFYEVLRARTAECLIRANGEFCVEEDQFDPPSVEVWSVEARDGRSILYANEEVWVLDPLPDDAPASTPQSTTKASVVIDGQSGCRTDAMTTVEFVADTNTLQGTLTSRTVTTGPESCGSTPVGERSVDDVVGQVSGP
jgi:hypothetical protein